MNSKAAYYEGWGIFLIIVGLLLSVSGIYNLMENSNTYLYSLPFLGGGLILLLIGLVVHHQPVRQARILAKQKEIQEYIDSIAPADMVSYTSLKIDPKDTNNDLGAGGQLVKYMFINKKKEVSFPESGDSQKYYIINIDFTPKYNRTVSGNTQSVGTNYGYNNNFNDLNQNNDMFNNGYLNENNRYGNDNFSTNFNQGSFSGNVSEYEVPTDAFMTLVGTNLDRSFTIHLIGEKQKHIQEIKQYFFLNAFEQKQVGIK